MSEAAMTYPPEPPMSYPPAIYAPFFCTGLGALTGLTFGACLEVQGCMPVIVGSGVGSVFGCAYFIGRCYTEVMYPEPESPFVYNAAHDVGEGK
jgi:hypothetical protein